MQVEDLTTDMHFLGMAGLLGALDAAGLLLHSDPAQLAARDAATAEVIARWLREHPKDL